MDEVLNNLEWLIWHKTDLNQTKPNQPKLTSRHKITVQSINQSIHPRMQLFLLISKETAREHTIMLLNRASKFLVTKHYTAYAFSPAMNKSLQQMWTTNFHSNDDGIVIHVVHLLTSQSARTTWSMSSLFRWLTAVQDHPKFGLVFMTMLLQLKHHYTLPNYAHIYRLSP